MARTTDAAPELIPRIGSLRGVAALLVLVHHSLLLPMEMATRSGWRPSQSLADFGAIGVDVFFVLSGFLMVHISSGRDRNMNGSADFLARRLIRIWPMYAIATIAVFAPVAYVWALSGEAPFDASPGRWLSLVFWPSLNQDGALQPILSVGWTLNYEFLFFLCFASALLIKRVPLLVSLSCIILALMALGHTLPRGPIAQFLSNSIMLEFAIGAALASAHRQGIRLFPWSLLAALFIFLPDGPRWLVWGGPALAAVSWAIDRPDRQKANGFLAAIGNASYSLYLFHLFVVQRVSGRVVRWAQSQSLEQFAVVLSALVSIALSIVLALVVYQYLERPLTTYLHRRYRAA